MKQMALLARGLSPCVWGHHVARCNSCIDYGSIPMCMGPPLPHFCADPFYWVYPHVYGATKILARAVVAGKGLSPCVWGHLQVPEITTLIGGSIPMCMGPPITGVCTTGFFWVLPHVYGVN